MGAFELHERRMYAAIQAIIPLAEGRPAIHVDRTDGTVFVCRRVSGLRLVPELNMFYGECDWADPPEARPGELSDGMAISYPDCTVGPGWWYDSYFRWYMVYDAARVARSLAGDHSWVPAFLADAERLGRTPRCT